MPDWWTLVEAARWVGVHPGECDRYGSVWTTRILVHKAAVERKLASDRKWAEMNAATAAMMRQGMRRR